LNHSKHGRHRYTVEPAATSGYKLIYLVDGVLEYDVPGTPGAQVEWEIASCAATNSNQLPNRPTRRPKQTQQIPAKHVAMVKVSTDVVYA
jgi:hypothetical protein